jgi:hypothetical protein
MVGNLPLYTHGLRNEIHFSNQVALDLASVHTEMVS